MEAQIPQEIMARVDALAKTLGTTTEFVFQRLCEDSVRVGWLYAIGSVVALVVAAVLAVFGRKSYRALKAKPDGFDEPMFVWFPFGLAIVLVLMLCAASTEKAINRLGAPTSYAITTLKGLFQ